MVDCERPSESISRIPNAYCRGKIRSGAALLAHTRVQSPPVEIFGWIRFYFFLFFTHSVEAVRTRVPAGQRHRSEHVCSAETFFGYFDLDSHAHTVLDGPLDGIFAHGVEIHPDTIFFFFILFFISS